MILKSKFQRLLLSALLVTAIVAPLVLISRASAVSVGAECNPSDVSPGDQVTCILTFEIESYERVSIQNLQLTVTGPGGVVIQATFDPSGEPISTDPQVVSVVLTQSTNPVFGYQVLPQEFQYTIIIDTNGLALGNYLATGKANTGDPNKPFFESGDGSFTITLGTGGGGEVDPTPTPTSVPDSTSGGFIGGTIFGIIIGVIVGLAALVGAGWLLWRRISG